MNKKNDTKLNSIFWLASFVLLISFIAVFLYFYNPIKLSTSGISQEKLVPFAQCLAEKGATMYGAKWCVHCQREKGNFGDSFKYVNYVECPDNIKLCTDKGIVSYPTWIFADGTKREGEQGLQKLSEESGCKL